VRRVFRVQKARHQMIWVLVIALRSFAFLRAAQDDSSSLFLWPTTRPRLSSSSTQYIAIAIGRAE
jgi:hypothetical protein